MVLEGGQLDLQPALACGGVPGEDVDDQRAAVEHLAVEQLLQVALLVRTQLVVDDEQVEAARRLLVDELGRPALAEVPQRIGCRAALEGTADDHGAGRLCQGTQLGQAAGHRPATVARVVEADEEGTLLRSAEVDHRAHGSRCRRLRRTTAHWADRTRPVRSG